ncbi:MAG: response regulator transcription factor [Clostridia bacterium]
MRNPAVHATSGEIVVIDDDSIMRELLADWLEGAGYTVRKAASCRAWIGEAVEALARPPALIVTDMFMPGPCGIEAIAALKRRHAGTAIIAVSGRFDSGERRGAPVAHAAGADRALAKPLRRAELLNAVAGLIGLPRQQ